MLFLLGRSIQLIKPTISNRGPSTGQLVVRFCSTIHCSSEPTSSDQKMEKKSSEDQQHQMPAGSSCDGGMSDIMSDSYGVEYATRSDEEGFGGIYGFNQAKKPERNSTRGTAAQENENAPDPEKVADH
ncbi:hypothetical protein HPP92_026518 [Vanilla planifolia]|uniref:Late embryogenesis abundant protein n=1 Tax=Vanilla planifolia TaxID=51239 RepID=A0A835PCP1_VANPL|nr:hypothetical protein HPP92_026518 [Vanilla planifolia]